MVRRIIYFVVLFVTICLMSSCSDEHELEPSYSFSQPCLDWGASKEDVKSYMDGFELQQETSTELHYWGRDTEVTISYLFGNDGLNSAVVMLNGDSENTELASSVYRGYNMVDSSSKTFMNEKSRTLGYTHSVSINGINYIMVSWAAVTFSNIDHV